MASFHANVVCLDAAARDAVLTELEQIRKEPIEDLVVRKDCILRPIHGGREDTMASKTQFALSVLLLLVT